MDDDETPSKEYGRLVEYDWPDDTSGQPRYKRSMERTEIPAEGLFIIDDGKQALPYLGNRVHQNTPSHVYPNGCEPTEMLTPWAVNPEGKLRSDGHVIDYTGLLIGPRRAYHLQITR